MNEFSSQPDSLTLFSVYRTEVHPWKQIKTNKIFIDRQTLSLLFRGFPPVWNPCIGCAGCAPQGFKCCANCSRQKLICANKYIHFCLLGCASAPIWPWFCAGCASEIGSLRRINRYFTAWIPHWEEKWREGVFHYEAF